MQGLELAEKRLGMDELCRRLGATRLSIEGWRSGETEMPDREFLRLVELISVLEPGWIFSKPNP